MITGNKGEWSEIYTLLKIIADKQLFAGDSSLNKLESLIFPIIKVLRDESHGTFSFSYNDELVIIKNNRDEIRIPVINFEKQAHFLLLKLQEKTNSTFSVPEIEQFINSFNCYSLKAKSSVKSDIKVVIHDQRTGTNPELGFSIKSQLGSPSTLLNAGETTNFKFKIHNLTLDKQQIAEINSINTARGKIQKRLEKIIALGGRLKFISPVKQIFENNLILIDSALPIILAEGLLTYYSTEFSKTVELVKQIDEINPLHFNSENNHPYYEYKIKRFLTDIALGMMPSKVWTGKLDATGGYLIVKSNGDVLCYHIYNQNDFEDYLYYNTKFDTASSTRHNFGIIYENNDELFINLNLQIRFL